MPKPTIITVIGARPQFVKAAVVSRALRDAGDLTEVIVHTGQHFDPDMSDVFFEELGIPAPVHHLGIGGGTHGQNTGRMLEAVERVLLDTRPAITLVFGDTDSTLAGALAAAKLNIPVAHVEAGLRSFNRRMPEEINRIVADHVSAILFAPTETAIRNLRNEGIPQERIRLVGDVMYDASLQFARIAEHKSLVLQELGLAPRNYVLATIHRPENTDDPRRLRAIWEALASLACRMPVVFAVHPRTRAALKRYRLVGTAPPDLRLTPPVGYLDMIELERNARAVLTDSGGVQKEAYFYRIPCITLRNETEWTELVDSGWNRLAPPADPGSIPAAIEWALGNDFRERPGREIYGRGDASVRIAAALSAAVGAGAPPAGGGP